MGRVDVDSVADELYGLPREEFTAARDARARYAREAGDRALATAIGKLRKPTSAAWLANLLARGHPGEVGELIELGDALREAHTSVDGETLQELSRQRQQVVHALVQRARGLGHDAGAPVSEAVARELEDTVSAALADSDAARELAAGRLVTALQPTGWFAASGTGQRPVRAAPPDRPDDARDAAARERRERRLADARDAVEEAITAHADARETWEAAERRTREAGEAVDDLARRLAEAERTRDGAAQELRFAQRAVDGAEGRLADAERRLSDLERRARPG